MFRFISFASYTQIMREQLNYGWPLGVVATWLGAINEVTLLWAPLVL